MLLLGSTAHLSTSPAVAESGRYRDFWADTYGDGLDFDSPEDIVVADDGPMMGLTNPAVADGKLSFTVDKPGYFSPLWGGYLDAIPHGREGSLRPIDASRYDGIVIRMRTDEPIDAGVRWYSCRAGVAEFCQGGFNFKTEAGWITYVFRMKNQADDAALTRAAWTGMISGLRIAFGDAKNNKVDVDYIRLIAPDDNGVLDGNFDITRSLTRPSWLGPADPTPAKGLDYTDVARKGDRWVFDGTGDLKTSGNATNVAVTGGALQGDSAPSTNAAPGDSFILLPLGTPLPKLSDFHNVAIKMKLDGPYSQQFKKGGGTAVRLRMKLKGSTRYLLTRPIAIYPSDEWLTFDLADRLPFDGQPGQLGDIIDPAYSKAAKHTTAASEMTQDDIDFDAAPGDYAGLNLDQPVIAFGIDPTEDYGQRHFVIDAVHLYSGPSPLAPSGSASAPASVPKATPNPTQKECWDVVSVAMQTGAVLGIDPVWASACDAWYRGFGEVVYAFGTPSNTTVPIPSDPVGLVLMRFIASLVLQTESASAGNWRGP